MRAAVGNGCTEAQGSPVRALLLGECLILGPPSVLSPSPVATCRPCRGRRCRGCVIERAVVLFESSAEATACFCRRSATDREIAVLIGSSRQCAAASW